jgi:hypothetical protein
MSCSREDCHNPVVIGIRIKDTEEFELLCEADWQKHCADDEKRWRKNLLATWSDDRFYLNYLKTIGV